MKKILIVNDHFPPDHWGGSSSVAFLQAKGLSAQGFDVRVFTTTQKKENALSRREYEGIPVHLFYVDYHPRWGAWLSLYNPSVLNEFKRELQNFAPDVVHFHNIHNYFSYQTLTIAARAKTKVFLTAHDVMSFAYRKLHHFINYKSKSIPQIQNYHVPWWVNVRDARRRYNPFRNMIIRYFLRKAYRIFAVSNALKQALSDNGISGNVDVVCNGVDEAMFNRPFNSNAFSRELNLGKGPVLLFVGRFTPDKGRDVLLHAFAKVAEEMPEARLLVVGFREDRRQEPAMWLNY
jgi:Glycosyltransferase